MDEPRAHVIQWRLQRWRAALAEGRVAVHVHLGVSCQRWLGL
jgi:hypothetical protein